MTIKELITILEQYPAEINVMIAHDTHTFGPPKILYFPDRHAPLMSYILIQGIKFEPEKFPTPLISTSTMTKIVYNACYGGFSLSETGIELYAKLKGLTLYSKSEYEFTHYYLDEKCEDKDYWSSRNIPRDDPALIEVIETLGDDANSSVAKLAIKDIPAGTKYRINEYDGLEQVMTIDDYDWKIA